MKKRLFAILMAAVLAVPTTAFAGENTDIVNPQTTEAVSEQSTETAEGQSTEPSSEQSAKTAPDASTETGTQAAAEAPAEQSTEAPETQSPEAAAEQSTASSETQSSEAAAGQSAETSAETAANGPVDLANALPEYQSMKWDSAKGCYLYNAGGSTIEIDPEDPEFYRHVFGSEEKVSAGNTINSFGTARTASGNTAYSPYTKANYTFAAGYSGYTVLDGIDVSSWNGNINWSAVKAAGIDFAIVRVGYRGSSDGTPHVDSNYAANLNGAAAAGITVGAYYFSQAITEAEAVDEAQRAIAAVSGYPISLPLFIDYEFYGTGRLKSAKLSADKHQSICNAFCTTVKNAGHTPGIYANKDMLTNSMRPNNSVSGTKYWMARYSTSADYGGSYEIWQYSSKGSVSGVGTNCDCNFMFSKSSTVSVSASPKKMKLAYGGSASSTLTAKTSLSNASYKWTITEAYNANGTKVSADKIASLSSDSGESVTLEGEAPGKVKVNVTASTGSKTASASVTVTVRGIIDGAILSKTEYEYNGKARKPGATVLYGSTELKKDTHYTISYTGNTNVGSAEAIITGKGYYCGTKVVPFTITPTDLSSANLKIAKIAAKTYSPKGISPTTTVEFGSSKLSSVKHYNLSYEGPSGAVDVITEAGEYTLVVNAVDDGVFTGSQTTDISFKVKPRKLTASMFHLSDTIINAGAEAPTVSAAYSCATLQEGTDYTLTDSSYDGSKGTYTITAEGTGNYTGKVKLKFKAVSPKTKLISTKSCEITLSGDSYTYNGKSKKPGVTVYFGEKKLKKDRDYSLSYKRSSSAGTAYAVLTGMGAYSGTASVPYTITEGSESSVKVKLSKTAYTFNAKVRRPGVTVTAGSKTLKKNSDYRVIYSNPNSRDAGTYQVTVELRGHLTGSVTEEYEIKPVKLSNLTVTVPTQAYTGEETGPGVDEMTFKLGDQYLTPTDIDMITVDGYSNNIKASSSAKVSLSGSGNFTGSKTVTFTIKK